MIYKTIMLFVVASGIIIMRFSILMTVIALLLLMAIVFVKEQLMRYEISEIENFSYVLFNYAQPFVLSDMIIWSRIWNCQLWSLDVHDTGFSKNLKNV